MAGFLEHDVEDEENCAISDRDCARQQKLGRWWYRV